MMSRLLLEILEYNWKSCVGMLSDLSLGDAAYCQGFHERIMQFDIVPTDILPPTAVEEMTAGGCDLTLFTCMYGGQNRLTARCNQP